MFADRRDAGHRLGKRLLGYKDRHPIVLALPRGGVPVAAEVAAVLGAPLDVLPVRKLVDPEHAHAVVGAVIGLPQPRAVLDDAARAVDPAALERQIVAETREAERRRALYRGGRGEASLRGRTVILVDDGVATATATVLSAAARAVRGTGPETVVVAVPVAERAALLVLEQVADAVVCLSVPAHFGEPNQHYREFHQVHDDQVTATLDRASRR